MRGEEMVEVLRANRRADFSQIIRRRPLAYPNVRFLVDECAVQDTIAKQVRHVRAVLFEISLRKDMMVIDLLIADHARGDPGVGVEVRGSISEYQGDHAAVNCPLSRSGLTQHRAIEGKVSNC